MSDPIRQAGEQAGEQDAEQLEGDSRRVLSRHYLAEIDRRNTEFLEQPDARPNSGLREGDISHADVNAIIRQSEKTVIFGQQTRLRAGILMKEDERLPRFHAGHDVVNYFYRAIRLIPDYLLDAIFARGISVTMVKDRDLLVYQKPRCHQSFHTGHTRKTIYIPEGVLMAAFQAGYHPWAFSEVLLLEAWKLLDYYLIVELARRYQTWMHRHIGVPGFYFVKDTLLSLNKHRRIAGEREQTMRRRFRRNSRRGQRRQTKQYDEYDATSTDTEFMKFYRYYFWEFYGWDRPGSENRPSQETSIEEQATIRESDILLRDPYQVANDTFSERRQSAWSALKLDAIKEAFGYPDEYQVDRDIVHQIAFNSARTQGQSLEPVTVDDLMHDLQDVCRFAVDCKGRSKALIEQLLLRGHPGIVAFYDVVAEEHTLGKPYITAIVDDFDCTELFKKTIQQLSTSPPEGVPNSVSNDVRDYLGIRLLRQLGEEIDRFLALPKTERLEGRYFLRALTLRALELARPDLHEVEREELVAPPTHSAGPSMHVQQLADIGAAVLRRLPPDREVELLFDILGKMDLHPGYQDVPLPQARQLSQDKEMKWGDNLRRLISDLRDAIPENPHTVSSDPAGVRARLNRFDAQQSSAAGEALLGLLVGVLIRLDRAPGYDDLVQRVIAVGGAAIPALTEVVERIDPRETRRQRILRGARIALQVL
jgi:hypothetical protein